MPHGAHEPDPRSTQREPAAPTPTSPAPIDPDRPTLDAAAPFISAAGESGGSGGWLAPGDRVGPFQILRVLGEGGFGVVYLAEQQRPIRRTVALKILKPGMDSREIIARFEGERQALAQLDHPGIATILDAGVTDRGRPYFAMEYVPGVTITTYADEHRLSIAQRVELMLEVCDAVQHAHLRGIIHRDLKPANILVSREPAVAHSATANPLVGARVRIIDFGIAKARTPGVGSARTIDGTFLGTPEYMSPEQAGSLGVDVDLRSDVYSLGVVLYQLLTGRLPIEPPPTAANNPLDLIALVREQEPRRPSELLRSPTRDDARIEDPRGVAIRRATDPTSLVRELQRDLDWIVLKCLEKDRERRYTSVRDLAADLRRYRAGEAVLASPPTLIYRTGKFVRRHRLLVVAGVAVASALVLGAGFATWGLVSARTQRDAAQREAATSQAVRLFLQDVLAAGDPEKGALPTTTIREALDAAARRVESGAFGDQPLVEAEVRVVLGDTYISLGLFDAAEPHTTRAVELRRQHLGERDLKYAEALNSLGYLLDELAKYPQAEAAYRACVEVFRAHRATQPVNLAVSMNNLASLLRRTGRLTDAEAVWREAIDIVRSAPDRDETSFAQMLDNLGLCLRLQGRLDEAEALSRQALASFRAVSPESPSVARSLGNIASLLQERGRLDEARDLFHEAADMQRRFFSPPHPELVTALNNLAIVENLRGRARVAEPLLREALSMCEQSYGPTHPETIFTRLNYAATLGQDGRIDEAEALAARVVEESRAAAPGSRLLARSLTALGDWRLEQRRFADAIDPLREALALRDTLSGASDTETLNVAALLLDALGFAGREEDARAFALDTLARLRAAAASDDARWAHVRSALAGVRAAASDADETTRREALDEMTSIARQLAADRTVPLERARRALARLAWLAESRGDTALAARWQSEARELSREPSRP